MRVALVQVASPDEETQRDRISRVESLLRNLPDVDIVVLPELWSAGYFHFKDYRSGAEGLGGNTLTMCREVAKSIRSYIHVGSIIEKAENGKLKNTSVLINQEGDIVHTYSKIHVFGYKSLEASLLTPGDSLQVAEASFGHVMGTTCYDLRFPGLWMEMSNRGAEIVIVPAAWPAARRKHWQLLTSARAVEHQIFVIACNAVGVQDGVKLGGYSRIVDPSGEVLGECGEEEEVKIIEIDPSVVQQVREEFPVIKDRLINYSEIK
ncbi:carbon-nitrogen hydrolase [Chromohalobacter japonicus]|uniref:Carbon-nitrogen hydrolase n=1 Tax=Chromohalobacter japonicus TaxID=223900 RepID=A0A1Q8THZ4_9GAMM|nr:nitrilase-related carbon-nitrogen hydrolase [Chromohalobacter japonicus]OLO13258.1 carbon-nitrogen hydrolase [Chromohalobacter japonicus]